MVRTPAGILHVEFVKDDTPDLTLRMVDYRLRLRRTFRESPIHQTMLVLGPVVVPSRHVDIDPEQLGCHWTVARLDELDPEVLLRHPTTAPLAALGHGSVDQRAHALAEAAELISALPDSDRGEILLEAAATLASIVLSRHTIVSTLEVAAVPVPIPTPRSCAIGSRKGEWKGRQKVSTRPSSG